MTCSPLLIPEVILGFFIRCLALFKNSFNGIYDVLNIGIAQFCGQRKAYRSVRDPLGIGKISPAITERLLIVGMEMQGDVMDADPNVLFGHAVQESVSGNLKLVRIQQERVQMVSMSSIRLN